MRHTAALLECVRNFIQRHHAQPGIPTEAFVFRQKRGARLKTQRDYLRIEDMVAADLRASHSGAKNFNKILAWSGDQHVSFDCYVSGSSNI